MCKLLVMLLVAVMVILIARQHVEQRGEQEKQKQEIEQITLEIWFGNTMYEPYLVSVAEEYEKKHQNVTIRLKAVPNIEYISALEQAQKEGNVPALYIIGSEYLQNVVRIGMAAKTNFQDEVGKSDFCEKALENLLYYGESYGYPLGFDTAVLMYHPEKIDIVPENFDGLIKQMQDSGASADTFFQWDKSKFLCNYGFVGNYAEICGQEKDDETQLSLDNENLIAAGTYYQKLCQQFSGDDTYQEILEQFSKGELAYTIVGSDVLKIAKAWEIQPKFAAFLDLTEGLESSSISVTDIMMVNPLSEYKDLAEEFAVEASWKQAESMFAKCGVLSAADAGKTDENQAFYEEYEQSEGLPKLMSVVDYWSRMKQTLAEVAKGKDCTETFTALHILMKNKLKS